MFFTGGGMGRWNWLRFHKSTIFNGHINKLASQLLIFGSWLDQIRFMIESTDTFWTIDFGGAFGICLGLQRP